MNWAKASFMANPWGTMRTSSPTRRRRKATKVVKTTVSTKRRVTKRPARLVKGSAAAKAYMAKIRKRRGK